MGSHTSFSPTCIKKGFRTKKRALIAMDKINNNPSPDQKTDLKDVYKCSECGEWHLTSMTKDAITAVKARKRKRDAEVNPSLETIGKRLEYLKTAYRKQFKK